MRNAIHVLSDLFELSRPFGKALDVQILLMEDDVGSVERDLTIGINSSYFVSISYGSIHVYIKCL